MNVSTRKSKKKKKKNKETNENENKNVQNLWDAAKAVQRRKFTEIQTCLKNHEKSQINIIILHLKELEKKTKPKPAEGRK